MQHLLNMYMFIFGENKKTRPRVTFLVTKVWKLSWFFPTEILEKCQKLISMLIFFWYKSKLEENHTILASSKKLTHLHILLSQKNMYWYFSAIKKLTVMLILLDIPHQLWHKESSGGCKNFRTRIFLFSEKAKNSPSCYFFGGKSMHTFFDFFPER